VVSSCPPNTNLAGLAWLKGQPPVLALEDSEYPGWLWTLLDEKKPGDGTSKPERRKQNRDKIKLQNFMKSQ
ncbi:mitochondrial ribosomal protein L37-domain-containing protein, partial [Rhizoctonia solani]